MASENNLCIKEKILLLEKNSVVIKKIEKERLQMKMCKICQSYLNFSINVEKKSLLIGIRIPFLAAKT